MKKIINYFKLLPLFVLFIAYKVLAVDTNTTILTNPIGNTNQTIPQLTGTVISAILGIVGSIALVMFVIGGFKWMTSGGKEESVKKGRDTLIWSTLGLVVIFAAYAILRFIFEAIAPGA